MTGILRKNRSGWLNQLMLGYIFLPPKFEGDSRTKFIQKCYRTGKVSILLDSGGVAHNVPIPVNQLKEVNFPNNFGEAGESVLCWINPFNGRPLVVALYNKEDFSELLDEFEYKIVRSNGKNIASFNLQGEDGSVYLSVDSDKEDGGNIVLNINNSSRNGKLKINVNGESDIYTTGVCNITSETGINAIYNSVSSGNKTEVSITDEVNIKPETIINLGNGVEPLVLGNTLKEKIESIIDGINQITVPTAFGPSGTPLNSVTFTNIKTQLEDILSKISNTE